MSMPEIDLASIPAALADLPLDRIEELEETTGQSFGAMIEELSKGQWSIATMRGLVGLLDPDVELRTLGELMAASAAMMGKVSAGPAE
jgi:hypothetical protein